jgi:hypothetical protein
VPRLKRGDRPWSKFFFSRDAIEKVVVFSVTKKAASNGEVFLSRELLQKKTVVCYPADRDSERWSKHIFPKSPQNKTIVFFHV